MTVFIIRDIKARKVKNIVVVDGDFVESANYVVVDQWIVTSKYPDGRIEISIEPDENIIKGMRSLWPYKHDGKLHKDIIQDEKGLQNINITLLKD